MKAKTEVHGRGSFTYPNYQLKKGHAPYMCKEKKGTDLGVKLIWPQLTCFCPQTGLSPVQKNQIRYLSNNGINDFGEFKMARNPFYIK